MISEKDETTERTAQQVGASNGLKPVRWPLRSAEEMKIHSARLICHPSPPNPLCGQLHQGEICYYANCETTEAFAMKIEEFLKSENWELARVEVSGVTTADALQGKPEVLRSLDRHGDFAMILGKHGSDN